MSKEIKLTADELALMSVFQTITGIRPIHCVLEDNNVFFLVDENDFPKMIVEARHLPAFRRGLKSGNIEKVVVKELSKELARTLKKNIFIIKYVNNPEGFLRNFFMLRKDEAIEFYNRGNNRRYAIIKVQPKRRGFVIGRGGFRAKVGRELAKKYFNLETVLIR